MKKQDFLSHFILQPNKLTHTPLQNTRYNPNKILKKAAVLIPLVQRNNELHVILTQRALHLKHHPGQISFPGGRYEVTDNSLAITALRETEEEIGIEQHKVELVGHLTSIETNSGYHVTPYIGFVDNTHQISIDRSEVRASFEVPFSFIINPKNFTKTHWITNNKPHFSYCCVYQEYLIWGATAQMLINLQQHLRPR
ncbi:CoA pyrophosphatase [Psychromonas aquatilis]|uniref:CoA pyrophosphatase n=1 Tax=Psychromonas aquatilis TaxID=2005072 RepID=A0ABU9GPP1_9GAMM